MVGLFWRVTSVQSTSRLSFLFPYPDKF
jgi:hypothetical protein